MNGAPDPAALEEMERLWSGGGLAARAAPEPWRAAIGDATGAEAELRLLALAGQARRLALRPAPREADPRPPLPRLALPVLPDPLRPRFREAMDAMAARSHRRLALDMLQTRGLAAHPLDWMPAPSEDVPALYRPWLDWVGGAATVEHLTADTWDDVTRAPRRILLRDLRRTDPAAARALLVEKLASRPAEERAELLAVMETGLSEEDAAFLEGLDGDRSGRVRQEARRLLARLGRLAGAVDAEAVRAVIATAQAGLLRRRTVFRPARKAKNRSLLAGDREVLEATPLASLAAALGTTPQGFAEGWAWGESDPHDVAIARIVAETGDDATAGAAALRAIGADLPAATLAPFAPRMDAAARDALLTAVAARPWSEGPFPLLDILAALPEPLRGAPAPIRAEGKLLASLAKETASRDPRRADRLHALGLTLPGAEAAAVLSRLTEAGLPLADPSLAVLRLAAALPDPNGDAP